MNQPLTLIIEDDEKLAEIFTAAIQAAELETETISHGASALRRLNEVVPAIVVLDIHLPEVSGQEILQHIRADKRLDKTRVIVATADPLTANSLRDKADLVLLKPISFSQLRDLAKRLHPSN